MKSHKYDIAILNLTQPMELSGKKLFEKTSAKTEIIFPDQVQLVKLPAPTFFGSPQYAYKYAYIMGWGIACDKGFYINKLTLT